MSEYEMVLRLGVAALAGAVLGVDRELRGGSAGIRTNGMVGLSSAAITISALLLYESLRADGGSEMDPLRVIQGLAQAIGFIVAGTIFVSRGSVHNLTSAAGIWLVAAIGIAAGAGQFTLVITSVLIGILLLTGVRVVERFIPGSRKAD
ncbi:MgtC/SapB transporter [Stappia sp. 22II-S9-Z10]|nr:MgtC/SapB transporter [Stappia sp. 22II-S9-Z10]